MVPKRSAEELTVSTFASGHGNATIDPKTHLPLPKPKASKLDPETIISPPINFRVSLIFVVVDLALMRVRYDGFYFQRGCLDLDDYNIIKKAAGHTYYEKSLNDDEKIVIDFIYKLKNPDNEGFVEEYMPENLCDDPELCEKIGNAKQFIVTFFAS